MKNFIKWIVQNDNTEVATAGAILALSVAVCALIFIIYLALQYGVFVFLLIPVAALLFLVYEYKNDTEEFK